jgi:hypothetical protein
MARPGIRDLVGRAMIDRDFLADLVREPALTSPIRSVVRGARGHHAGGGQDRGTTERERARALQVVLMKRWAT